MSLERVSLTVAVQQENATPRDGFSVADVDNTVGDNSRSGDAR